MLLTNYNFHKMPLLTFWINSKSKMYDYRAVKGIFLSKVMILKGHSKKLVIRAEISFSLA